ncbi:transcriptional regulator, IclR family [Variovorax sp. YR266]|uniref:IclR family transcriptional regulator n=1 Tax=Variovorax sp. YR266 TaxID=1884386 RepID=UPI00089A1A96|nr:IclR family transcriptional regulator [Variovorax sp. YR266]SDZ70453.1 transcriptional regulator, IclR family [Variovorax sp. YR266]
MSEMLGRSFKVLEYLAEHPQGVALSTVASELKIPLSASHRLLTELIRCGYVRQNLADGHYVLTIKLVSVGLSFLSNSGIVDVAQPLLDQLAAASGELVRLAVVDGEDLTFVAKAQGATHGLRYDPDMGLSVMLSCSAAGHAWLSTMSEDDAMALVAKKGLGKPEDFGPKAPTTLKAVMAYVKAARQRGFSMINEVFAPGMTAMAAPVFSVNGAVIGVVTIAGPAVRLTPQRMEALGPALIGAAEEVARASGGSALFKKRA